MALNMTKVLAQKAALEERMTRGSGGGGIKWWKPANGTNQVRILPPWTNEGEFEGQFWREVSQHWNVSEDLKGPTLCPKLTPGIHEDCPICEFVDELKARKNDAAAQDLRKKMRAKVAFFLNIIDRKDPTYSAADVAEWKKERPDSEVPFVVGAPKIQTWACQPTIFDQILAAVQVNEIDVTDLEEGKDFQIKKHPNKDPMLTRYEVQMLVKNIVAGLPPETKLPDLAIIGKKSTYEELSKLLASGEGGDYAAGTSNKRLGAGKGYRDSTPKDADDDKLPDGYLSNDTVGDGDELLDEMTKALAD